MHALLSRWLALNDWLRASLIALLVLVFMHLFVLRFVTVRSSSMYATLFPGDLVGVTRWNNWTGYHRGDIAVFRDPVQDDRTMARRDLVVKRIVGLPGDVVQLKDGKLFVNGERIAEYPNETHSYLVRMKHGSDPSAVLGALGLPPSFVPPGRLFIELPLNKAMADSIVKRADVVSAEHMSGATGSPSHIFPFSPNYPWNTDDYGPITVPQQGDSVRIDAGTIPLYDRIISRYEARNLKNKGNDLSIDGETTHTYVVQQDYYFVLGDSRHYSADSRFWGFVPADHLVGRAAFTVYGKDLDRGGVRAGRWFKGL